MFCQEVVLLVAEVLWRLLILKAQLLVCQEPMEAGVLVLGVPVVGGVELFEVSLQAVDRSFLARFPGLVNEVRLQVAKIFWGMLILVHGGLEVSKFFELVGLLHDLIENLPKQTCLLFGVSKTHVHPQEISHFCLP